MFRMWGIFIILLFNKASQNERLVYKWSVSRTKWPYVFFYDDVLLGVCWNLKFDEERLHLQCCSNTISFWQWLKLLNRVRTWTTAFLLNSVFIVFQIETVSWMNHHSNLELVMFILLCQKNNLYAKFLHL
jgi:hypothetical protein